MADAQILGHQVRQIIPTPEPMAHIDTRDQPSMRSQANGYGNDNEDADDNLVLLYRLASAGGDVSTLLEAGQGERLGTDAVRQWLLDAGSSGGGRKNAARNLHLTPPKSGGKERD